MTQLADVVTTDPDSDDDESLPGANRLSDTPNTPRSLCFELSSTIVCILPSASLHCSVGFVV